MRRARIYKPPIGTALFEVGRDKAVVLVDLTIAGFKIFSSQKIYGRYEKEFDVINNTLEVLGLNLNKFDVERLLLKERGRTLLCCLYRDNSPIVRYVAIATFSPGALLKAVKRLENAGWKKKVLIELKSKRPARI